MIVFINQIALPHQPDHISLTASVRTHHRIVRDGCGAAYVQGLFHTRFFPSATFDLDKPALCGSASVDDVPIACLPIACPRRSSRLLFGVLRMAQTRDASHGRRVPGGTAPTVANARARWPSIAETISIPRERRLRLCSNRRARASSAKNMRDIKPQAAVGQAGKAVLCALFK
jgi:hypothetical protein